MHKITLRYWGEVVGYGEGATTTEAHTAALESMPAMYMAVLRDIVPTDVIEFSYVEAVKRAVKFGELANAACDHFYVMDMPDVVRDKIYMDEIHDSRMMNWCERNGARAVI